MLQASGAQTLTLAPGATATATVGYAPFTPTELIVKDLEAFTQSHRFKAQFPVSREDVKVMAYRNRNSLNLTVAMAMVDRFVEDEKDYFDAKERVEEAIVTEVGTMIEQRGYPITDFGIKLNALDVSGRGIDGCYLTVTGTSAENGDSGQVGRGNDPAGIIPLNRPMASEAAPGKNPVSHVGKIYNLLCFKMADRIYREVPGCDEVYTWLLSQIGKPINEPSVASVQLVASSVDARMFAATEEIVVDEFEHLDEFCRDLYEGVAPKVC